jgi:hypothetical protein
MEFKGQLSKNEKRYKNLSISKNAGLRNYEDDRI